MFIDEKGWNVSEYEYKGFKYQIRSRGMNGMKLHVFNPGLIGDWKDAVLFTDRYSFIKPKQLQDIAENVIDRIFDLINKQNGMLKCDVQFTVNKYNNRKFSIVHNLPEISGLSIEDAVNSWVARTDDYSAASLAKYINSKDTEFMAVSLNHYLRKGFKKPKNNE